MLKKLIGLLFLSAPSFGFTNQYYIQNSQTYQGATSAINVASGTIQNFNASASTTTNLTAAVIVTSTLTTQGITGTATANNAAVGNYGESVSSVSATTNAPSTGAFGDLISITLTAGDWDISASGDWLRNGATWSQVTIGISQTSGNSGTGLVNGSNEVSLGYANTATVITEAGLSIPAYRQSLSGTTTIYYKYLAVYSAGGPPTLMGRLSARRIR